MRKMRKHGVEIEELRRQRKRRKPRLIPPGHARALDLTFIASPFGPTFTVLGIIDAGSRKLLRLKRLPGKCAFIVLGHLLMAIGQHGLPLALRTDNEAMFTSKLWGATLKALGIVHRRGPPCQHWRNGRIERLFGTLKCALRGLRFTTAEVLQATLDRFAQGYNELRPHQGLGGLTPNEAWQRKTMRQVQAANATRLAEDEFSGISVLAQFHRLRC